jgi:hypothetical protein
VNVIMGHGKTTSVLLALAIAGTAPATPGQMTIQARDLAPMTEIEIISPKANWPPPPRRGKPKGWKKGNKR